MSYINQRKYLSRKFFGIYKPITSPAYDSDAQAYFNVNTSITSSADKTAINNFYLGLKSDGIYTKIKAMYLPIWGSASACKWNLVNPLDTNAAFRLTFTTGWTYSSSGITPNGTSAYARTEFSSYSQNSQHISYYSRTDSNTGVDLGNAVTGSAGLIYLYIRDTNTSYLRLNTTGAGSESSVTNTDGKGFYQLNRLASNKQTLFKNNTKNDFTVNSTGVPAGSLFLGGAQSLSSILYGNKQCSFSSIGDGLTDTEASNFSNRVNILMTYFGINVYNSWLDESSWNDSNNWTD